MTRPDTAVLVFARKPVAGQVKTRLIDALGAEGAAALHRRLVEHALATAGRSGIAAIELWCAPDPDDDFFRACAARFHAVLKVQDGADLGERMKHACRDALRRYRNVILIGSDAASLSAADLNRAASLLDAGRPVLGPAEDGGYVLIALTRAHRSAALLKALFEDIPWGTSGVMARTRSRLSAIAADWSELSLQWDVDRPEDVGRFEALAGGGPFNS